MPPSTTSISLTRLAGEESPRRRHLCLLLAMLLIGAFFLASRAWWVPAHPGVDQNGYLVGGKMLTETGSMALRPRHPGTGAPDPFQFVGRMWVGIDLGTAQERYYPKYPVGLPLIYAAALKLGGAAHGVPLTYMVSPIGALLGLIATFLLGRMLVGSIPSLFALLVVACSPAMLQLVNNPNSHAASFAFVTWGMYLAFRWWQAGGWWRPLLGAFLAGCAVSIRYTEGLLVLPLAVAAISRLSAGQFRDRRAWVGAILLAAGWSLPVIALLAYNKHEMGVWTGYGPTNESTGFAWSYFAENWDTLLRTLFQSGLMLLFPMALGGVLSAFWWDRRVATMLALWIVPNLLVYTAYYWAPDGNSIGYARFFLSIFPPMAIAATGLLTWPGREMRSAGASEAVVKSLARSGGAVMVVASLLSAGMGVVQSIEPLQMDRLQRLNLLSRSERVRQLCPAGSILVGDDTALFHHLQFANDFSIYAFDFFNRAALDRLLEREADEPQGLDPARARYIAARLESKTQTDLDAFRDELVLSAMGQGKHVYLMSGGLSGVRGAMGSWRRMARSTLEMTTLTEERDPYVVPRPRVPLWAGAVRRTPPSAIAAAWTLYEVTGRGKLEPPATRPAPAPPRPATRPATRPAATRPATTYPATTRQATMPR